jgi:outer membrane receptor protein involved in Fe transport
MQLNLGADWDVPGVQGLSLNARAVHTSTQFADAANLQKLPSWTRLDLGATWDALNDARIDNVTRTTGPRDASATCAGGGVVDRQCREPEPLPTGQKSSGG